MGECLGLFFKFSSEDQNFTYQELFYGENISLKEKKTQGGLVLYNFFF